METEIPFVKGFGRSSKRIMFWLITKMEESKSSTPKDCKAGVQCKGSACAWMCVSMGIRLGAEYGKGECVFQLYRLSANPWGCIKAYHVVCSFVLNMHLECESISDFHLLSTIPFA